MSPREIGTHGHADREQLTAELQRRSVQLFVTLASIGDAVITSDGQGGITFLNPMAESLSGWTLEDAVGLDIEDVFKVVDDATGLPLPSTVHQAVEMVSKTILPPNASLVRKDGSRIPIDDSAAPILDMEGNVLGAVLVFRDITDKKKAEMMIKYRSELDRMAARISTAFITSPVANVDAEINSALKEIGTFLRADRSHVVIFSEDGYFMNYDYEWCGRDILPLIGRSIPSSVTPHWAQTLLNRNHIHISNLEQIPREATDEQSLWKERGIKTLVAVPMLQEHRVLGFIQFESITEPKPWPEAIIDLLYLIGNVFASAIGRRDAQQKLEAARAQEVEIGSRIQQTLLLGEVPSTFADYKVAARTLPSKKIDGDFYDFLTHPNRCLDIIFGDVMGKGVPAALLAAGSKTEFLRSLSHLLASSRRGVIPEPEDIVNSVHAALTPQLLNLDSYVTLSYVRFDPDNSKVTLVDCGNTRMLKCTSEGAVEHLSGFNVPLGFTVYEVYAQAQFDYDEDDVFVLYSDGATEARNPSGALYGIRRLRDTVTEHRHLSPILIVKAIEESVIGFVGKGSLSDDFTCVVIKISQEASRELEPGTEEVEVTSELTELATIRDFLRGFCERLSACVLDDRAIHQLELAVTEVASNIMKHAYAGKEGMPIWVRLELGTDAMRVRLTHTGEPFAHPDRIPAPSLQGLKESGFGLFIINRSVDKIDYGVDDKNRQYIDLIKRII